MSANLMFEPIIDRGKDLSDELKYILRDKYELEGETVYSASDLSYLQGLADANVKDAQKLVDAINKYGSVRVWLQY